MRADTNSIAFTGNNATNHINVGPVHCVSNQDRAQGLSGEYGYPYAQQDNNAYYNSRDQFGHDIYGTRQHYTGMHQDAY